MHIDILIPTWNRPELLRACVKSIEQSIQKDISIFVIIDGNLELIETVSRWDVAIIVNQERRDWVFSINKGLQFVHGDGIIYASDDLVFDKDCIANAVVAMKEKFPDGDGLVAIKQSVVGCNTAFGLFGHKFIERFPEQCVFCPDYVHYGSDSELGRFARSINRLHICEEARVIHHRIKDATYSIAKPMEVQDFHFINARREAGLLWGRDFQLLRKEK
ncbi:MAG TPA: glycosyltransferase [Marinobacter sp.]|uniref:Glycosyltransferase 2-like domain-containing protein n=1 Tax=marine sediment metagenome TaxID=412755 RepID=A0A0F9VFS3_9ZZZZ|nr:glycosyltransferase [Marinobacter sp.]